MPPNSGMGTGKPKTKCILHGWQISYLLTHTTNNTKQQPTHTHANANNPTTITFEDTSFNFGNIKQGDKVKHTFKFTNSGKNPLLIVNSFGTCGCTVPDYPKNPIKPGESGVINVVFNSSSLIACTITAT
jgi:hypothetical protein